MAFGSSMMKTSASMPRVVINSVMYAAHKDQLYATSVKQATYLASSPALASPSRTHAWIIARFATLIHQLVSNVR